MVDGSVSCTDYSQYNIVYEFKENNVLTISAEPETPEWFANEIGEHSYAIITDDDEMRDGRELKINYGYGFGYYWHRISSGSKELIIDYAPLDGETQYLIKIQ